MSNEWKPLEDLTDVGWAQANKWEIQRLVTGGYGWVPWDGKTWAINAQYRGRPAQPKKVTVKLLGWLAPSGLLYHATADYTQGDWKRVPSEDKTVEVEQ
jgi:hypothetical protein